MSVTIDANILVYASNAADPAHDPARALVQRLGEGPELVYLFWPTVMGYLRIVTHPAILPRPLAPLDAATNMTNLLTRTHVRSPGEEDGFWELYRNIDGDRLRGNDVPDAHLVALMLQHGVRVLYSRDRGFRRFASIEVRDPFA
ncbi:MAG: PIN domain-containing protein [Chloroflexi bacterium]|nr:PIN domain-containing protein [Chloroflexota bacterium]